MTAVVKSFYLWSAVVALLVAWTPPVVAERLQHASRMEAEILFDARTGALLAYAGEAPEAQEWPAMRGSELIGKEVVDRLHRDFGEVVDFVVDLDARRIRSVIVNRLDDWSPGTKLVTVPIEALSLPPDLGEAAALNYSRERWE